MPHFDALIAQKQALKQALLQNQTVVNLLVNTGDNMTKFENVKLGSKSPAAGLIKTHFYVPDATTTDQNFISMRSLIVYSDNNVVKETGLTVYVICNEDQIDLMQGSRADLLANEIDKILNNGVDTLFGLGGITLQASGEVEFNDGYSGWQIPYVTHERNRGVDAL